ncbi:MAG: thioesterase family protein, partial [Pseudomonadota bacterium]
MPPGDCFGRDELVAVSNADGFVTTRTVRFQDVDAAGIVFHPRILEYFHDAYVEFLEAGGIRLQDVLATGEWASPVKRIEGHFLRPLRFGDQIEVAIVKATLRGSELCVGYRLTARHGERQPLAVGSSLHVFVRPSDLGRVAPPAAVA